MNNSTNVTSITSAQDQRLVQNLYDLLNGYSQSISTVLDYLTSESSDNSVPLHTLSDDVIHAIITERRALQQWIDDTDELMEQLEVGAIAQAELIDVVCPEVQKQVGDFMEAYGAELSEAYAAMGYEQEEEETVH